MRQLRKTVNINPKSSLTPDPILSSEFSFDDWVSPQFKAFNLFLEIFLFDDLRFIDNKISFGVICDHPCLLAI